MIRRNKRKGFTAPPVVKMLVRGYLIIIFILLVEHFGIIKNLGAIIFSVTIVSISMMFGISYLLMMHSRPVRKSVADIPTTILFFVIGSMMMYFVALASEFEFISKITASVLLTSTALVLVIIGVASYVYEVLQRSRPPPARYRFVNASRVR
jgi:chromate transport protein ChrA